MSNWQSARLRAIKLLIRLKKHPWVSTTIIVLGYIGLVGDATTAVGWLRTLLLWVFSRPVSLVIVIILVAYLFQDAWIEKIGPLRAWLNRRHAAGEHGQLQFNYGGRLAGATGYKWDEQNEVASIGKAGGDGVYGVKGDHQSARPVEDLGWSLGRPNFRWRAVYSGTHTLQAGKGKSSAEVGGIMATTATESSTIGTSECALARFRVPACTLDGSRNTIWFVAWGRVCPSTKWAQVGLKFGDDSLFDSGKLEVVAEVDTAWIMEGRITSISRDSHKFMVRLTLGEIKVQSSIQSGVVTYSVDNDTHLVLCATSDIDRGLMLDVMQAGYLPGGGILQ